MSSFLPCILIPHYNHARALLEVLARLVHLQLPVLVIDDGSAPEQQSVLRKSVEENALVSLVFHEHNRGKGAAVMTGLREASTKGYSHAVQIDADGQHNVDDIVRFLGAAKSEPDALVLGLPQFGREAPWERVWGRKLTTLVMCIEAGSCAAKDGLCGFRVYPVHKLAELLAHGRLQERMGFDTEVIVKLMWSGIKVLNVPTAVSYPLDGISHFRYFQDNVQLVKMHALLLLQGVFRVLTLKKSRAING